MSTEYSYMEFEWATGTTWHIRKLSDKGKFMGGGADTPSLCGTKHRGWDVNHAPPEVAHKPDFVCLGCWTEFLERECLHTDKASNGANWVCVYCAKVKFIDTEGKGHWL